MRNRYGTKRFVSLALTVGLLIAVTEALILIWTPEPSKDAPRGRNTTTGATARLPSVPPKSNVHPVLRTDAPLGVPTAASDEDPPRESRSMARDRAASEVSPGLLEFWKKRLQDSKVGPFESWFHRTSITQPGPDLVSRLDRIQLTKLPNTPNPIAGMVTNLYEARLLVGTFVSMVVAPGACVEYKNTFFISGGRSAIVVTNFEEGYAIRRGEPTIYYWDRKDIDH
jgi:hypothetical protein